MDRHSHLKLLLSESSPNYGFIEHIWVSPKVSGAAKLLMSRNVQIKSLQRLLLWSENRLCTRRQHVQVSLLRPGTLLIAGSSNFFSLQKNHVLVYEAHARKEFECWPFQRKEDRASKWNPVCYEPWQNTHPHRWLFFLEELIQLPRFFTELTNGIRIGVLLLFGIKRGTGNRYVSSNMPVLAFCPV